jgi:hypothetical protein
MPAPWSPGKAMTGGNNVAGWLRSRLGMEPNDTQAAPIIQRACVDQPRRLHRDPSALPRVDERHVHARRRHAPG